MDRQQAAGVLAECGLLMELEGENPFKVRAYQNAARLETLPGDLSEMLASGQLAEVKGLGQSMREHLTELVRTGRLGWHELLLERVPPGLVKMLRIGGVGPKRARQVREELGVESIDDLKAAAHDGRLAALKGFGAKMVAKILEGIAFLEQAGERVLFPIAAAAAEQLAGDLRKVPGVVRVEIAGSVRRRLPTCKDIDLLAVADDPPAAMAALVGHPLTARVVNHGPTKSSVVLEGGVPADLRVVAAHQFPFAWHYFTGSKAHNIRVRQRAIDLGFTLNEYALKPLDGGVPPECADETALFAALGMAFVPPELREDAGEIEAALAGPLPRLVQLADLAGAFHNHTTASDGQDSLETMAEAARKLGWAYLGIADHSQAAAYAGGLSPDKVLRQQAEIDALNAHFGGAFRLFKGIESDILVDGALDYGEPLLSTFDYVVASVHSHFGLDRDAQTQRIIRAIENPRCTMLGHATGRILLRREGYAVDLEAVLKAAARHGVMVEINADPHRLDLDWTWCRRAKALGVLLVVNPDAHEKASLANVAYGVGVARKAGLERADLFNSRQVDEVARHFAARRG